MKIIDRGVSALYFGIACLAAACSGSHDSPDSAAYQVRGTAAYGHPVVNQTVKAIDSTGKACGEAMTATDGSYTMDTSDCAPGSAAFSIVNYTTPSGATMMAVGVPPAGVPIVSGVVNINPLTTLTAYSAAGMVPSTAAPANAAQVLALLPQVGSQQYRQAESSILTPTLLQTLQNRYGVATTGFSAMSTAFKADGTGLDAFFDAFALTQPTPASVRLASIASLSSPGLAVTVTLPGAPTQAATTVSASTVTTDIDKVAGASTGSTTSTGTGSDAGGSTVTSKVGYVVGGSVSGLSGGTVTLLINGGNPLAVQANTTFTFPVVIANTYAVTVGSQPSGQTCTVGNGSGSGLNANVTNVVVTCSAMTYTIGGIVSGLSGGDRLILLNNASDSTAVNAGGAYVFSVPVAHGGSYGVTIGAQPAGKACTVSNASASNVGANVSNVSVACSNQAFTVGGNVSGLNGTVTLQNNGSDSQTLTANGSFTFATPVVNGMPYGVSVNSQPNGQTCSVANGTGTVMAGNVTTVSVTCASVNSHVVYVYAPENSLNKVYGYRIDTVTGTQTDVQGSPYTTDASNGRAATQWVATDPLNRFLYTANVNTATVSGFTIDRTTGALTPITGSPFAAGTQPSSIVVNAAGTLAFVANSGSAHISVYSIDQTTGALTQVAGSPFSSATPTYRVVITPDGKFLYANNQNNSSIDAFSVDANTGMLTQVTGSPFAGTSGTTGTGLGLNPSGTRLYSTHWQSSIDGFNIDSNTGALSPIAGSPFTSPANQGWGWRHLGFNTTGTLAYAAAGGSNTGLLEFSVNASTGVLTATQNNSYDMPQGPGFTVFDPSGLWAYISNIYGVTLAIMNVNPVSGVMTPIPNSPLGLGGRSLNVVVVQP